MRITTRKKSPPGARVQAAARYRALAWSCALACLPAFPLPLEASGAGATIPIRNWGLHNSAFSSHIEAQFAWRLSTGSRRVVVAVVDSGIDPTHPDLRDNLWTRPGTKDEYGFDFVLNRRNPVDTHGHGTHIAGIIGATAKSRQGAIGVAPHVSIMALRYVDGKSGLQPIANTIRALNYAIENGARIINYSSEGRGFVQAEYDALARAGKKGILVVVAAGNQGENNDLAESPTYPASYNLPNLIAVAATSFRSGLLARSNFGPLRVHLGAPGEKIFSTLTGGRHGYLSGTSQATAFVSGIAALMLSENPSLTPTELKRILMYTADRIPDLRGKVASGGRVNAFKAVFVARELKSKLAGVRWERQLVIRRFATAGAESGKSSRR